MLRCFTRQFFLAVGVMVYLLNMVFFAFAQVLTPPQVQDILSERTLVPVSAVIIILAACLAGWKAWASLQRQDVETNNNIALLAKGMEGHCSNPGAHQTIESLQALFVPEKVCEAHHQAVTMRLDQLQRTLDKLARDG